MAEDDLSESDILKGIKRYQILYADYQLTNAQNLKEEAIELAKTKDIKSESINYFHVSVSEICRTNFPTPRILFSKHVVEPALTEEKARVLTKQRIDKGDFRSQALKWKNTVFEDPLEFSNCILKNNVWCIVGMKRVPCYRITPGYGIG